MMRLWICLVSIFLCLFLILPFACNNQSSEVQTSNTPTIIEGALPVYCIGDKWKVNSIIKGTDHELSFKIIDEKIVDGKTCYVMECTSEPPLDGIYDSAILIYEKTQLDLISMEYTGKIDGQTISYIAKYSYKYSGDPEYPKFVGMEYNTTEKASYTKEFMGDTQTWTEENIYTSKIEKIEDITVPAGTFHCFKVVRYDDSDNSIEVRWASDRVKLFSVQRMNYRVPFTDQLQSYSLSDCAE